MRQTGEWKTGTFTFTPADAILAIAASRSSTSNAMLPPEVADGSTWVIVVIVAVLSFIQFMIARDRRRAA